MFTISRVGQTTIEIRNGRGYAQSAFEAKIRREYGGQSYCTATDGDTYTYKLVDASVCSLCYDEPRFIGHGSYCETCLKQLADTV